MQAVTTIGLDIAKSVFQVHGVDAAGQVLIRRQLKRRYVLEFLKISLANSGPSTQGTFQKCAQQRCEIVPATAMPARLPPQCEWSGS
jgi:hypothetical protein